jgi:hypothetical protein
MIMRTQRKIQLGVLTFAATALTSTLAQAATCAVSVTSATATLGAYDPFSSSGITNASFTFTVQKNSATAAADMMFYLSSTTGVPDIKSGSTSVVSHSVPNPSTSNPPNNSLFVPSAGWDNSGSMTFTLLGSVPAALDKSAGVTQVPFDLYYDCSATSGNTSANNRSISQALTVNYTVQSALQASYVGSALDFGEVSGLNNGQINSHTVSGNVRVASSGPFQVDVTPGSGTAWAMTYPGGSAATAAQRIWYSMTFLGQTSSHASNTTFDTTTCQRTGISGQNLPISVKLAEATTGKTAAPDYSDYISVTVTPLAAGGTPQSCSTMNQGEGH